MALSCKNKLTDSQEARSKARAKVYATWKENEHILDRIQNGEEFDQVEFVQAVKFFEKVTEIPSRDRKTTIGRLPSEHLKQDLRQWREWYAAHGETLSWDPVLGVIRLDRSQRKAEGKSDQRN